MNKTIGGLSKLNTQYFDPDKDCFVVQKAVDQKLYKVPFNTLMKSIYPHHDDRVFEWNETNDILLSKVNKYTQAGYDYFDCRVADIDNFGSSLDIPEPAKFILLKMSQTNLDISGPAGWEPIGSGITVFLLENMQYPKERILDVGQEESIPDGLNHFNMTPINHASFRCLEGQTDSQRIWATAWSY
jgi:hypothetical protein